MDVTNINMPLTRIFHHFFQSRRANFFRNIRFRVTPIPNSLQNINCASHWSSSSAMHVYTYVHNFSELSKKDIFKICKNYFVINRLFRIWNNVCFISPPNIHEYKDILSLTKYESIQTAATWNYPVPVKIMRVKIVRKKKTV